MNCPVCSVPLVMADRQGVEIDYCPKCRGVWLDRGELDKLIERSGAESHAYAGDYDRDAHGYKYSKEHYRDDDDRYRTHPHKKKSFFGELFDFD